MDRIMLQVHAHDSPLPDDQWLPLPGLHAQPGTVPK
jgi:hypothetical protein